ncbi:MAG TPA: sulfite exporter TauE/SafE family protein [Acidobacteriaceae bacterium]|nr:sulfite exporter TauE/SafE family protein [Acidobacteriaceae bacterium]
MSILRSRRKIVTLLLCCAPILLLATAHAVPLALGGGDAYGPSYYSGSLFLAAIAIGLVAGLITGCIGAGGGFVITPALMSIGIKGIMAVGTSLFNIFAKAIMGTAVHKRLGNVSMSLAVPFMLGSFGGVYIGGSINRALYAKNPILSDAFISLLYVFLLGLLGFYSLYDFLKHRKEPAPDAAGTQTYTGITRLAVKCQSVNIPPMMTFDEDFVPGGRRISWVMLAGGGFFVGALASMMGAGGGFATFPMFVYGFGVSSMTTVGTDILQIIFTAGVSSITQYAVYGYIFYSVALGMLLGSLVGIQIGALTTKVVKGIHIRGFYAIAILAGFIDRLFVLPLRMQQLGVIPFPRSFCVAIEGIGNAIFWIVCSSFAFLLLFKFVTNIKALRGEAPVAEASTD